MLVVSLEIGAYAAQQLACALDFAKPDDIEGSKRYYFRTNPLSETADARYARLNHIVTLGLGRAGDGGVI
jgi:Protein of unknown function (DUF3237)